MSKEIRKYNYIIGSGWWCGDNPENEKRIIVKIKPLHVFVLPELKMNEE